MKLKNIPGVIADAVLIFCCAVAAVCFVPTAYEAEFTLRTLLIAEAPIALVISYLFHRVNKLWFIPALIMAYLAALAFIILREEAVTGAKLVWFSAGRTLSLDFSFLPTPEEPLTTLDPVLCVTVFLILAAGVISIIAGILLIKCKSPVYSLILPIPFIALGFIYTDCPPAKFVFILLLIYWGGALFGRELLKEKKASLGIGKIAFLILLIGLIFLIPKISPEDKYESIPFSERKGFLDTFGSIQDSLAGNERSNPKEYDLTKEGEREINEGTALLVNSSVSGAFYLRTHSYGLYEGNNWGSSGEFNSNWHSMERLGLMQKSRVEYMRIREARMTERATPYGFIPTEDLRVGESFVRANGRSAYVWSFKPNIGFDPIPGSDAEVRYLDFAREHYTLPEGEIKDSLLDLITVEAEYIADTWVVDENSPKLRYITNYVNQKPSLAYFGDNFVSIVDPETEPYEAARLVALFVSESAEYSLVPGKIPESKDFVIDFMTTLHKGYCVHFASATTALLQAIGIPARYVVGYRVEIPSAETWTEITRESAHAWTEIYITGVGWVPIESTSGFTAITSYQPKSYIETLPTPVPVPSETIPPVEETPEPSMTPRPTRIPQNSPANSLRPTKAPVSPGGSTDVKQGGKNLWWLLTIPAAIAVWELIGVIIKARRKKRFTQSNSKAAITAMLKYLYSLRRHGAKLPPDPQGLGNEAAFSNHSMKQEQNELYKLVEYDRKILYKHNPFMRFILRRITFKI